VPYCGEQCLSGICYSSWKLTSEQPTELSNIGMTTRLELDALPNDKLREMKLRELIEENGADVKVSLELPDGTQRTQLFKMGTLVSYLKAYIEKNFGYTIKNQVLHLNGHEMLDPLCLSDIPTIKESEINFIKVTTNE